MFCIQCNIVSLTEAGSFKPNVPLISLLRILQCTIIFQVLHSWWFSLKTSFDGAIIGSNSLVLLLISLLHSRSSPGSSASSNFYSSTLAKSCLYSQSSLKLTIFPWHYCLVCFLSDKLQKSNFSQDFIFLVFHVFCIRHRPDFRGYRFPVLSLLPNCFLCHLSGATLFWIVWQQQPHIAFVSCLHNTGLLSYGVMVKSEGKFAFSCDIGFNSLFSSRKYARSRGAAVTIVTFPLRCSRIQLFFPQLAPK